MGASQRSWQTRPHYRLSWASKAPGQDPVTFGMSGLDGGLRSMGPPGSAFHQG